MKKLKLIKSFLLLIIISSCGYTPIYKNIDNLNFKINIVEKNGDRDTNNQISSNLYKYSFGNHEKVFDIKINSKYTKNILTKDTTGAATEYQIIIDVIFGIKSNNSDMTLKYSESFNLQSITDKLEEKNYEKDLSSNSIKIITQKLILNLSRANDN